MTDHPDPHPARSRLVLASSSPWRRQLLERLTSSFECHSPDIDETPHRDEPPEVLVARLARQKAEKTAIHHAGSIIVGSDQIALHDGSILGKPGHMDAAFDQLSRFSGQHVRFLTALTVIDAAGMARHHTEPFDVYFRHLTAEEINAYLARERPLDCAGSFRMEGLGITLFERLDGRDPNALIGLPLIALCRLLRESGMDPLLAMP
ncbi:Maf family protein [Larsenimonas rhizosphaerae]|uniref:Maf family protein n=1 Tax=Larsenimonas rhizosphaerae TaxID=2944682 RepID=UPI0020348848|nr:Maf family protein [Larsenimonas rhizosphaerae]MCM2130967.1 Maf family nucleotide pyrophosphatase [Larsenimonas rhizosphaerae]